MILQGKDATEFAKKMYHPPKEYIEECRKNMERIDQTVAIERTKDGFVAHFSSQYVTITN